MYQNHRSQRESSKSSFQLKHFITCPLKLVNCQLSRHQSKGVSTLKMKSGNRVNNVAYLRILTVSALHSLHGVLGAGIDIGVSGAKPSKSRPLQYCTIGSLLSSIECMTEVSPEVCLKPIVHVNCDGIDLMFTHETQTLMCIVCFSKIPIVTANVDLNLELVNSLVNLFGCNEIIITNYLFVISTSFPLNKKVICFSCFPRQISNKISNQGLNV
jgi:hypothetical protein